MEDTATRPAGAAGAIRARLCEQDGRGEFYLTATVPAPAGPRDGRTVAALAEVRDAVCAAGARIVQERIFAAEAAIGSLAECRAAAFGQLADAVAPTWLAATAPGPEPRAGVLIHAVRAEAAPRVVVGRDGPAGRVVELPGRKIVFLNGLTGSAGGEPAEEARAMLENAEAAMAAAGVPLPSLARTWMWLGDILAWYGPFNRVRTEFFRSRGLMNGDGAPASLPASTGVGVRPAGAARCAMDLIAAVGGEPFACLMAGGRQDSAFKYGSAFSRALRAPLVAGQTLFVSGTASIDAAGRSEHVGDARAQIRATLDNMLATLAQGGGAPGEIVQSIAYCKTAAVAEAFAAVRAELDWPCLTVIGDVCRDELLFEIEATAWLEASGSPLHSRL